MTSERLEVQRLILADPASIFEVLSDPHGHVAIDSSGIFPVISEGALRATLGILARTMAKAGSGAST
jgi:hypothetical protein